MRRPAIDPSPGRAVSESGGERSRDCRPCDLPAFNGASGPVPTLGDSLKSVVNARARKYLVYFGVEFNAAPRLPLYGAQCCVNPSEGEIT
jgi:hypothetical protein